MISGPLIRKKAPVSFAVRVLRPRGTEHKDTAGWFDADGLEQLRMTKGELDQLADLSHLLAASTNIVIADIGKIALLVLSLDQLALGVDDCILCDDTEFGGISFHYLL